MTTLHPVRLYIACFSIAVLSLSSHLAVADPPAGYYDTVDATNSATMRATLHDVIDDHTRIPYTSGGTDTWVVLESADEDPNDSASILDVYKNASYAKQGGGNSFYDREHTWPKSYGFPTDHSQNSAFTDCHMLRLADASYNGSRNNVPYDTCNAACDEKPTDVNNGQGGGTGVYPGNSNWRTGSSATGTWETWISRRGDVARSLFYMDIRFEGGTHGSTGASEPDLILTDNRTLIANSNTGSNESIAYMGVLSTLLAWHIADPVDQDERDRNDIVALHQINRNPFVDHPEWVECLFNNNCSCNVTADCDDGLFCNGQEDCIGSVCQFGGDPCPGESCDEATDSCFATVDPWINEFHYDNDSGDTGEFVEIAGLAGTNLTNWRVISYNGATGATDDTVFLGGTIPDQDGCMGVLDFDFVGLQNGAPDGMALVDPSNQVIEFISYEGSFTAIDGPASGLTSVDIGVDEDPPVPVGEALQLSGTGFASADFTWQPPAAHTRGQPNTGQTFTGCGGCAINADCEDGLYCNGVETCDAQSTCQPGSPVTCDDGVTCTDDTCDEASDSCSFIVNHGNCDDGLFCNGVETCDAVNDCLAGSDPCPGQGCDEVADMCISAGCNNDSVCDVGEDCMSCPNDCPVLGADPNNSICETADGEDCITAPNDCNFKLNGNPNNRYCCGDGTAEYGVTCGDSRCSADGNSCTDVPAPQSCCGDSVCEGAENIPNCAVDCAECTVAAECDDFDLCTIDDCIANACSNTPLDCDDSDACTDDTCSGGVCSNDPIDCDDGDLCTVDSCDIAAGCMNDPLDCDDSDACTTDSCAGGVCFNDPIDCDDGESCTADSCDMVSGCSNDWPSCGTADGCCGPSCNSSNDPDCCLPGGSSCSQNGECCSNKCKGNGVCR